MEGSPIGLEECSCQLAMEGSASSYSSNLRPLELPSLFVYEPKRGDVSAERGNESVDRELATRE